MLGSRASGVGPEPRMMTWARAAPVLGACIAFDLARLLFEFFWLAGPALAGTAVGLWLTDYIGSFLASLAGGAVALGAGLTLGVAFEAFGIVMAMVTALLGWLTVCIWSLVSNPRIFKTSTRQKLRLLFGWGVSEVPLIGSLPAMTITLWLMYRTQIKNEKAEHRRWQQERDRAVQEERVERMAELNAHQEQIAHREQATAAANDNEASREVPQAA